MKDIRTLCGSCKKAYETAGYKVIGPIPNQQLKQPCEICTKLGYDYLVEEPKARRL